MVYQILPYTYQKAKQLGVKVFPSDNPKYKLEVYDFYGNFITYSGDSKYLDFPHYIKNRGLEYANERRRLYRIRHAKDIKNLGSRGYYSSELLW